MTLDDTEARSAAQDGGAALSAWFHPCPHLLQQQVGNAHRIKKPSSLVAQSVHLLPSPAALHTTRRLWAVCLYGSFMTMVAGVEAAQRPAHTYQA